MPPLEPNQLSEEKIRELQRKVEKLEETLSATVSANEEEKAGLSQKLQAEEEKVLQIEKDKRFDYLCCSSVYHMSVLLYCTCVCVGGCGCACEIVVFVLSWQVRRLVVLD